MLKKGSLEVKIYYPKCKLGLLSNLKLLAAKCKSKM